MSSEEEDEEVVSGSTSRVLFTIPCHCCLCCKPTCRSRSWTITPGLLLRITILVLVLVFLILLFTVLPYKEYLDDFFTFIDSLGKVGGPALYCAVYTLLVVLFVPGLILTLAAGFMFGLGPGVVVVVIGSNIGALCAFILGRSLFRSYVQGFAARNKTVKAIDDAIRLKGAYMVFLYRLSPVLPFNALNYALSLTSVTWYMYSGASLFGMLPGTVLYVYLGSILTDQGELFKRMNSSTGEAVFFWIGLAITIVTVVVMTWYARRVIKRTQDEVVEAQAEAAAAVSEAGPTADMDGDRAIVDENDDGSGMDGGVGKAERPSSRSERSGRKERSGGGSTNESDETSS